MMEQRGLTDERIELLKLYGVKPHEISHLKTGTTNKIGKDRMKGITTLLNAEIIDAEKFVPFDPGKKKYFTTGKIFVLPFRFER